MKNIIIITLLTFVITTNTTVAQPIAVKKGFNKKYPSAENIKWFKQQDHWKVDFTFGDRKTTAEFDLEGNWLNAQQEIRFEDIGVEVVKDAISKDFANCKIHKVIINNSGMGTWYKVDGICGSEKKERLYDHIGNPPPKI